MHVPVGRRFFVFALFMLALTVLAAANAHAETTFRWKVQAGDKFEVTMTQDMKQSVTVGDETVDVPNNLVMYMTWTVDSVDDKAVIHMSQTIDRIRLSMQVSGVGDVQYDSAATEEPAGAAKAIAEMFKPMVGVKFTQEMDNRGKVLAVQVPPEALKGLKSNPLVQQFFSNDNFKDMLRQAAPVLPDEAINEGYSWKNDTVNNTPVGKMSIAATYTYGGQQLAASGRSLDKFTADVKLAFEEGVGPLGAKIKILDQDNSGEMLFDQQAGHFVETRMKQTLTMQVTVGNTTVDQRIETTVAMFVKRIGGE